MPSNRETLLKVISSVCAQLKIDPEHVLWCWDELEVVATKAMKNSISVPAFAFASVYMHTAGAASLPPDVRDYMMQVMQVAANFAAVGAGAGGAPAPETMRGEN